jgi:peptide/nickel transport system permease protein
MNTPAPVMTSSSPEAPKPGSGWWRAVIARPALLAGGLVVAMLVLVALFAPWLVHYPPDAFHLADRLDPPGAQYWFGTDEFGRDVYSRVLMGTRLSLFIGLTATVICMGLGTPLGLFAGYVGGRIDELLMRALDIVMSFPSIVFGMLVLSVTSASALKTAIVVGIVYTPAIARITRSVTLSIKQEEYVHAARVGGESHAYILFGEILPNAWPPIIVEGSLRLTFAILVAASLSFLGFGAQPPDTDWGLMISDARPFMLGSPWIALFPGLAMCITVFGCNLLGDGLRQLLDPRFARGGGR